MRELPEHRAAGKPALHTNIGLPASPSAQTWLIWGAVPTGPVNCVMRARGSGRHRDAGLGSTWRLWLGLQAAEEVVGAVVIAGVQDVPGGDLQGVVLGARYRAATLRTLSSRPGQTGRPSPNLH